MKKVVLVLVCSIVIIVFIALNYLLWDRENNLKSFTSLENLSASKSVSIDALGKEIKNLEDANADLRKQVNDLNDNKKSLQDLNSKTVDEKQKISNELSDKIDLIFVLKQQADLKPLEGVVSKWVESVDKGQYETAYQLQTNLTSDNKEGPSLTDFSNRFKDSVKNIKLKSIKLVSDDSSDEKKGELVFDVILDVKKVSDQAVSTLNDGQNERYFSLTYNKYKKTWEISNILGIY